MKKLEFTDKEKSVIRLYVDGEMDIKECERETSEEQRMLLNILDKAKVRLLEYPEVYDFVEDMILWAWDEYVRQEYNEKGIVLTDDELVVLKQNLNGEFGIFSATEYQKKHFSSVIDKADDLMQALGANEEAGDDLIEWFWKKYKDAHPNA